MKEINGSDLTRVSGGLSLGDAANGVGVVTGLAAGGIALASGVAAPAAGLIGFSVAGAMAGLVNTAVAIATAPANIAAPTAGNSGDPGCAISCTAANSDACMGGGGGGGGKVICTELCRNGVIEHDVWMADIRYSRQSFSAQTMRGYHVWGIPYVKLMRKYPAFAKLAAHPTRWFAADIAYRMGIRSKPNYAGWALRELAFRPICWTIGIAAKARDWRSLWATPSVG